MILSLHSLNNFQYGMVIQIFCGTERKSVQLIFPCVFLRHFYETRMMCKKVVSLTSITKKVQCDDFFKNSNVVILTEALGQSSEYSDRSDLEWKVYLYNIYSLVASLIITLTFHCTLHLIHNEWSRRLEKRRGNMKCFSALSWPWHIF